MDKSAGSGVRASGSKSWFYILSSVHTLTLLGTNVLYEKEVGRGGERTWIDIRINECCELSACASPPNSYV